MEVLYDALAEGLRDDYSILVKNYAILYVQGITTWSELSEFALLECTILKTAFDEVQKFRYRWVGGRLMCDCVVGQHVDLFDIMLDCCHES